jgi:A/G-specific adenine glycosylase
MTGAGLAGPLLEWFDRHGRKDLPWQRPATPYRVWVSEIMLQQTQVSTVIPYYLRFMERFPDLRRLAAAPLDDVLGLWSGLGYYARARNLHRAAAVVAERFDGRLPADLAALQDLPGIGRSTAGAILALAFGQRHAILDGNVRRVLARLHAIDEWPGRPATLARLWRLADEATPAERVADYTQAIMDFGATLCTRARPACDRCPFAGRCLALAAGAPASYPRPRPRMARPVRAVCALLLTGEAGGVLLERRAHAGIWGGLWSLPEPPAELIGDDEAIGRWCRERLRCEVADLRHLPERRHELTHLSLVLRPVVARATGVPGVMEGGHHVWYNDGLPHAPGMATPIRRLIRDLLESQENIDGPQGSLRQAR